MGIESDRAELRDQYRLAVEEYRFQTDLNWRRAEYFFVLNVGVLIAAVSLLSAEKVPRGLVALVFGIGASLALLSILANQTQHGYYRAARTIKARLEDDLELGVHALAITPRMGSPIKRLGRVFSFLRVMLIGLAMVDLVGVAISTQDALTREIRAVRVAVRPHFMGSVAGGATNVNVVVSRRGRVVASQTLRGSRPGPPLRLQPGSYDVSVLRRELCHEVVRVSKAPLQLLRIACRQ